MFSLYFQLICHNFKKLSATATLAGISLLLLTVSYGCNKKAQEEVQLDIKSVEPTNSNGVYNVVGSTNLPDSSLIAIAAVRYLIPIEGQQIGFLNDPANNNRSILARQIVEVKQGQWQANLNLWQVTPNGQFQEVWQAHEVQMKLRPDSNVIFIATFEPAGQLKKSNLQLEGKQLRFTNEGEIYVQARQTMPISLPVRKTTPPRLQPEDLNNTLGYQSPIQVPILTSNASFLRSGKFSQTNAPLKPSEFLR
ncbi:hypothetical protein [Mastigocladopsis repens]|uniref:hypothetical protein n=1 Tax=Mastigocladopsis repens TaxID=221287 RepID=UPI0004753DE8|nr:hypothetical protein [Mastigocladopsis repens]